jgi:ABC-type glycerol-3-phosphate transport system substrate-binding protein
MMNAQIRFTVAALALIATLGLAACSGGDAEPLVVSEARASTTSQFDYGWRTPQSPTAVRDGTVREYY